MTQIKYNEQFKQSVFSSFFLGLPVVSSDLTLRKIDQKILNLMLSDNKTFFFILNRFFVDFMSEIKVSNIFSIIKLFLKEKDCFHLVPLEFQGKIFESLDNLKGTIKKKSIPISVFLGYLEFYYAIRTKRLSLKMYSKYKNLFLHLLLEKNFPSLSSLFFVELEYFSCHSYSVFQLIFLGNVAFIGSMGKNGENFDVSIGSAGYHNITSSDKGKSFANPDNQNNVDSEKSDGKNSIKEENCVKNQKNQITNEEADAETLLWINDFNNRFLYLGNLLIKFNAMFENFINKKVDIFYIGSYRLLIRVLINTIFEFQGKFADGDTELESCLNLELKVTNGVDLNTKRYVRSFLDDFFNEFDFISEAKDFNPNSNTGIIRIMCSLDSVIENIFPYDKLNLDDLYTGNINETLMPLTFNEFLGVINLKKDILIKNSVKFNNDIKDMDYIFAEYNDYEIDWEFLGAFKENSYLYIIPFLRGTQEKILRIICDYNKNFIEKMLKL